MADKYTKVAWRGKRLSDMKEGEMRAALYEVYEQRVAAQQLNASADRMWAAFDRAFEAMDRAFKSQDLFFRRAQNNIRRGARFRL